MDPRSRRWAALALLALALALACREDANDLAPPSDAPIGWFMTAYGNRGLRAPGVLRLDGEVPRWEALGTVSRSAYDGTNIDVRVEAVSPDGRRVLASQDTALYVLPAEDDFTPRRLPAERGDTSSRVVVDAAWTQAAYSSDDAFFVVALSGDTPARRLSLPSDSRRIVGFSGYGSHLIVSGGMYVAVPTDGGVYRSLGDARSVEMVGPYVLLDRGHAFTIVDLRGSAAGRDIELERAVFSGFYSDEYALFEIDERMIGRVRLDGQGGDRMEPLRTVTSEDHRLAFAWLDGTRLFYVYRDETDRWALFESSALEANGPATQLTPFEVGRPKVIGVDAEAAYLCDGGLSRVDRGGLEPKRALVPSIGGACQPGGITPTHVVFCGSGCTAVPKSGGTSWEVPSGAFAGPDGGFVASHDFSEAALFIADDTGRAERITPWGQWTGLWRTTEEWFLYAASEGGEVTTYAFPLEPGRGEGRVILRGPHAPFLGVYDGVAYFSRDDVLLAQPLDGSRAYAPRVVPASIVVKSIQGQTDGRLLVWTDQELGLLDLDGGYERLVEPAFAPTNNYDARRRRIFWADRTRLRTYQAGRATTVLDLGERFTTVHFFDTGNEALLSGAGRSWLVSLVDPGRAPRPVDLHFFVDPRYGEFATLGGYAFGVTSLNEVVRVPLQTATPEQVIEYVSSLVLASPPHVGVAVTRLEQLVRFGIDGAVRELGVRGWAEGLAVSPDGRRVFFKSVEDGHVASLDLETNTRVRLFEAFEISKLVPLPGGGFVVERSGTFGRVDREHPDGVARPLLEVEDGDVRLGEVIPRYAGP